MTAEDDDLDIPLINLSNLEVQLGSVETGVTSGADPTDWDPIGVGGDEETCPSTDSRKDSTDQSNASVCQAQQQQKDEKPN